MRNRSPAKSAASEPPVPARISRIALRSIGGILGQQHDFDLLLELTDPLLDRAQFTLGQFPHFAVGRILSIASRSARSASASSDTDFGHQRLQFGIF
jgi:hypothetical protein